MEKHGEIRENLTPPDAAEEDSSPNMVKECTEKLKRDLEDHLTRRAGDRAKNTLDPSRYQEVVMSSLRAVLHPTGSWSSRLRGSESCPSPFLDMASLAMPDGNKTALQ